MPSKPRDEDDVSNAFPSSLKYLLPIDEDYLRRAVQSMRASPVGGKRLGRDWLPRESGVIETQAEDDVWIRREDLRPLDDVCTKFCTKTFFPDAHARINMVANVLRLYDRLATQTRLPVQLIFKGGVMLRLVLLQFWNDQPLEARERAIAHLSKHKAISVSDFDFEAVSPRGPETEAEKHRLLTILYVVLLWLLRRLEADLRGETPSHKRLLTLITDEAAAREDLRARLQAEVDGLKRSHPMHGARIDHVCIGGDVPRPPSGYRTRRGRTAPALRRNLFIFPDKGQTYVCPAEDVLHAHGLRSCARGIRGDLLYATCSLYINETPPPRKRAEELRPCFHLARIKHTFVVYYRTKDGQKRCDRLAGEMVDLSLSDPLDEVHAWKHRLFATRDGNVEDAEYRAYTILGIPNEVVVFRSFSPANFLADHEAMLHRSDVPPWDVPKYGKRVVRYTAFLVACALTEGSGAPERGLRALRLLAEYLSDARAVASGPMPRTGVLPVDRFARREHDNLASSPPTPSSLTYLATVRSHLRTLVGAAVGAYEQRRAPRPLTRLDAVQLAYMHRHVFDARPPSRTAALLKPNGDVDWRLLQRHVDHAVLDLLPEASIDALSLLPSVERACEASGLRGLRLSSNANAQWTILSMLENYVPAMPRAHLLADLVHEDALPSPLRPRPTSYQWSNSFLAVDAFAPHVDLHAFAQSLVELLPEVEERIHVSRLHKRLRESLLTLEGVRDVSVGRATNLPHRTDDGRRVVQRRSTHPLMRVVAEKAKDDEYFVADVTVPVTFYLPHGKTDTINHLVVRVFLFDQRYPDYRVQLHARMPVRICHTSFKTYVYTPEALVRELTFPPTPLPLVAVLMAVVHAYEGGASGLDALLAACRAGKVAGLRLWDLFYEQHLAQLTPSKRREVCSVVSKVVCRVAGVIRQRTFLCLEMLLPQVMEDSFY